MVMAEQQHREYLLDSLRLLNDLLIWQRWEQRRLALEQGSARCLDLQWQQRRHSSVLALAQQWLLGLGILLLLMLGMALAEQQQLELAWLLASLLAVFGLAETLLPLRSEEHTSELQSRPHLVCRLLLEKKKKKIKAHHVDIYNIALIASERLPKLTRH